MNDNHGETRAGGAAGSGETVTSTFTAVFDRAAAPRMGAATVAHATAGGIGGSDARDILSVNEEEIHF